MTGVFALAYVVQAVQGSTEELHYLSWKQRLTLTGSSFVCSVTRTSGISEARPIVPSERSVIPNRVAETQTA